MTFRPLPRSSTDAWKLILVLAACATAIGSYLARMKALDSPAALAFYGVLFLSVTALLCASAFMRAAWPRLAWAVAAGASFVVFEAARRIFGAHVSYYSFMNLVSARGFVGDTLVQFGQPILLAVAGGLLLAVGIAIRPAAAARVGPASAAVAFTAAPLGVGLLFVVLIVRNNGGLGGLPPAFTPLAYLALAGYERTVEASAPERAVDIDPLGQRWTVAGGDIVLIMDESVRGDYLDINRTSGVRSGLERQLDRARIHNFGLGASVSNCSGPTNLVLRFGGTRETRHHAAAAGAPSIWQYARRAGFDAVYIDAQRTGGRLHNDMQPTELDHLDAHVQFDGVPVLGRDQAAAVAIADRLGNGVAEFIYVNKVGAHFPVHDKFPNSHAEYRPMLHRGGLAELADTGRRSEYFDGDWVAYRNSYRNTILWNTGAFFDRLFDRARLDGSIIFYTSDHGQSFHERGEPGLNTHCSPVPTPEEGVVPMVVIAGDGLLPVGLEEAAARQRDRFSQFSLFATVLRSMGYPTEELEQAYEPDLLQPPSLPQRFYYASSTRPRAETAWQTLVPSNLIGPRPVSP